MYEFFMSYCATSKNNSSDKLFLNAYVKYNKKSLSKDILKKTITKLENELNKRYEYPEFDVNIIFYKLLE